MVMCLALPAVTIERFTVGINRDVNLANLGQYLYTR